MITFDMSGIFCNVLTQKVPMFLCVDIYYPTLLSMKVAKCISRRFHNVSGINELELYGFRNKKICVHKQIFMTNKHHLLFLLIKLM